MTIKRSSASEDAVEFYTRGACHFLALAIHRHLGWPMVVVNDPEEIVWQDENDPDNYTVAVLHVYAQSPDGKLWDIRGVRDEEDLAKDLEDVMEHFGEFSVDAPCAYDELLGLTMPALDDDGFLVESPLCEIHEDQVEEAWHEAQKWLSPMEGFPAEVPKESPSSRPAKRHVVK